MVKLRASDTIRGFVTIPKGIRVYGFTPIGRRKVQIPTGRALACQGPRDASALHVGVDGIGPVSVEPKQIKRAWLVITMRGGAYRAWNAENGRGSRVPGTFFHDGGTNPIPANVAEYLSHFGA